MIEPLPQHDLLLSAAAAKMAEALSLLDTAESGLVACLLQQAIDALG